MGHPFFFLVLLVCWSHMTNISIGRLSGLRAGAVVGSTDVDETNTLQNIAQRNMNNLNNNDPDNSNDDKRRGEGGSNLEDIKQTAKWKKIKQDHENDNKKKIYSMKKKVSQSHETTRHTRMMEKLLSGMDPLIPPMPDSENGEDTTSYTAALSALGSNNATEAVEYALSKMTFSIKDRLEELFKNTKTAECRAKIANEYTQFLNAIAKERPLPFEQTPDFVNECPSQPKYDFEHLPDGISIADIQGRTYRPPRSQKFHTYELQDEDYDAWLEYDPDNEESDEVEYPEFNENYPIEYLDDPNDLILCYVILTHDNPDGTIRLVETLYEPGYQFVIHVDGKAEQVFEALRTHFAKSDYVHLVPSSHRVRVNWGAFSMVNATIQALDYVYAVDPSYSHEALHFHKIVHLASTSYPLASNMKIRQTLASHPLDTNFLDVILRPTRPGVTSWHYFIECDDAVHRIYRLKPLISEDWGEYGDNTEVDIYTSSQWFIISREFGEYIAKGRLDPSTLVAKLLEYMEHVVVADESFFGTLLRHAKPFCYAHHNDNFLHLQFDRWENEVLEGVEVRDKRKCLMPDPDHCGRSPTTMTLDYLPVLELAKTDLFARKFDDAVDSEIKDILDVRRQKEEEDLKRQEMISKGELIVTEEEQKEYLKTTKLDTSFQGHGILIVARETLGNGQTPLCMGLGPVRNFVKLVKCFHDDILPTLADGWETGAVIEEEVLKHNRWELGPCSTDGYLKRLSNGTMFMTPGQYIPTGPRCHLTQMDGIRAGRCLDSESDRVQPGGIVSVFPCRGRWHQFISFGGESSPSTDELAHQSNIKPTQQGAAPQGSIHFNIPRHITKRIEALGRGDHYEYLCIGVKGRSNDDEEEWAEDEEKKKKGGDDADSNEDDESDETDPPFDGFYPDGTLKPLSEWENQQLVTTRCSNTNAVLEWVIVPFIVEDGETGPLIVESSENRWSEGDTEEDDVDSDEL